MKVLELQALDSRIDQLAHQRAHLVEDEELRRIAADQALVRDQVINAETRASDIKREQDKLESDIDQVRRRMVRDQQRLDEGSVSAAKELGNLQHEIASLQRRQRELEDVDLEVMERLDEVDRELIQLQTKQEQLRAAGTETEARRAKALETIARDDAEARSQRDQVIPAIGEELFRLYDKLRHQYGGVGAVAIRQRRCDGCRLEISATDLERLRSAPADAVLRCEECRRIQVRVDESGL